MEKFKKELIGSLLWIIIAGPFLLILSPILIAAGLCAITRDSILTYCDLRKGNLDEGNE